MNEWVKPGERVDDLQRNGLQIIQDPQAFCFGMDAVLLADFSDVRAHDHVIDYGTGTGILPLLMSQNRSDAVFDAVEIQPALADMAERSVEMNHLCERIHVHCEDYRKAWELFGRESMDLVVCNPPYGKQGGTILSSTDKVQIARHEAETAISETIQAAAAVLKNHGRLSMVFPANRIADLFQALREFALEPKRIRMVCSKVSKPPYLMLVEAVKNAKPFLLWMPPLVVYEEDGTKTLELKRIYHQSEGA